MESFAALKPTSLLELDEIFSRPKRIDRPIVLDSKPYSPFRWSIFFFYPAIFVASMWLLIHKFYVGDLPDKGFFQTYLFAAFVGVFFVPIVGIFYLVNLLFPTKLFIDDDSIILFDCGIEKKIKWEDVESIAVKRELVGAKTVFRTTISGKRISLKWGYYFGVDPICLKDFLILQKSLLNSRPDFSVNS